MGCGAVSQLPHSQKETKVDRLYAIEAALARCKTRGICDTEGVSSERVQREAFLSTAGSEEEGSGCKLQGGDCMAI
jgi:hypothetical protein